MKLTNRESRRPYSNQHLTSRQINQQELKDHFSYDPDSGLITKTTKKGFVQVSERADCNTPTKRVCVGVNNKRIAGGNFVILYTYGFFPEPKQYRLYFINKDQSDLRLDNIKLIKIEKPLTQEYIKEILNYDPETGIMSWKYGNKNQKRSLSGKISGNGPNAYFRLEIDKCCYSVHRLAWLYMTGS